MNLQDYMSHYGARYDVPTQLLVALSAVTTLSNPNHFAFDATHAFLWDVSHNTPYPRLTDDQCFSSLPPADFSGVAGVNTSETEFTGQRSTWGAFALHGSRARAAGYRGDFPALCSDPDLCVRFTLVALAQLRTRYFAKHGWAGVMTAYDAGRPRMTEEGVYENRDFLAALRQAGAKGLLSYR